MNLAQLSKHERQRFDFAVIADWIPHGERVLDLGCGDGALLRDEKRALSAATVLKLIRLRCWPAFAMASMCCRWISRGIVRV